MPLAIGKRPLWKRVAARIGKRALAWKFRHFRPGMQAEHWVYVADMKLKVATGVFDPSLHFTSAFLAEYLSRPGVVSPTDRVLDVGTGSGIAAIAAARVGAKDVVAVDVNPQAVICAQGNIARMGLRERVDVRESDLFAAVPEEQFDLLVCNPPYFRGVPANMAEHAYMAGADYEWLARFSQEARGHLSAGGRCLMVIGDAADVREIIQRLRWAGWKVALAAKRDILVEVIYIFALRLPESHNIQPR
ncbi:MAG TPA: methyltransferase [Chloroflexia bacterium]|nr:methyltransferase [Chloroflexia bacterium]